MKYKDIEQRGASLFAPLIDCEGGDGNNQLEDSHFNFLDQKLQNINQSKKIESKAKIIDIIMTASFIVFFIGNMVVQCFYLLFWTKQIGNTSDQQCVVSKVSEVKNQPTFYQVASDLDELALNGATNISQWIDLTFMIGSILYIIFDIVLILLIIQNCMRPKNKGENKVYSVLIQVLITLGGIQMIGIFWLTMFTKAGKICAGNYLQKETQKQKEYYQVTESCFIRYVTILQVSIFLVVAIALSQYKSITKIIDESPNEDNITAEEKQQRMTFKQSFRQSRFSTLVQKLSIKNSSIGPPIYEDKHLAGQAYLERRLTNVPNFKNFKGLKWTDDIRKHYIFGKEIGKGSFGVVYLAKQKGAQGMVAIKSIKKRSLGDNPLLPQMMLSELLVIKACDHPNVMQVKEVLEDKNNFYIACEYMEGGELFDRILDVKKFSEADAAYIIIQILRAINYLHKSKGIVHRDLKPENVLLVSSDQDNIDIKITDFGFSCFYDPENGLEIQLGTALYMAPEIIKQQKYDEKVDIWSIGVISYMILTGRVPYSTNPPNKDKLKQLIATKDPDFNKSYIKDLSEPCQTFLKKLFTRDVSQRPTASEMLQDEWLVSHSQASTAGSMVDLREQQEHMKEIFQFSQYNKFSKTITSLLLGLRQDAEDITVLKALFHKIDVDNDGTISIDEFVKASEQLKNDDSLDFSYDLDLSEVFTKIDLDGDGRIDFHEFCVAAANHKKLLTTENLKLVFQTLDIDQSGTIEIEEFKNCLPSNFKRGKQYIETSRESAYRKAKQNQDSRKNQANNPYFKDTLQENEARRIDQTWEEIVNSVDTDGDGKVSFEEFEQAITKFMDANIANIQQLTQ